MVLPKSHFSPITYLPQDTHMSCLQGLGHTSPKRRQLGISQAEDIWIIRSILKISNSPLDGIIIETISKYPGAQKRKIEISQIRDA
jgi:hypothetical protein